MYEPSFVARTGRIVRPLTASMIETTAINPTIAIEMMSPVLDRGAWMGAWLRVMRCYASFALWATNR